MRELKFRAWDKKRKKYHYFDFGDINNGSIVVDLDPDCIGSIEEEGIYNFDIEQYTTFKTSDKGVKIFAGDKVEFLGYGLEPPVSGIVEFRNGSWYVGEHHELYYGVENYLVEIIGTIHEVIK